MAVCASVVQRCRGHDERGIGFGFIAVGSDLGGEHRETD